MPAETSRTIPLTCIEWRARASASQLISNGAAVYDYEVFFLDFTAYQCNKGYRVLAHIYIICFRSNIYLLSSLQSRLFSDSGIEDCAPFWNFHFSACNGNGWICGDCVILLNWSVLGLGFGRKCPRRVRTLAGDDKKYKSKCKPASVPPPSLQSSIKFKSSICFLSSSSIKKFILEVNMQFTKVIMFLGLALGVMSIPVPSTRFYSFLLMLKDN